MTYSLIFSLSLRQVSAVKESERIIFYLSTSRSISALSFPLSWILDLSFSPTLSHRRFLSSFAFILIRHSSSLLSLFGRWLLCETKRHPNSEPCYRKSIEVTDGTAAESLVDWREIVRLGEFSERTSRRASFRLEETRSILTGHVIAS